MLKIKDVERWDSVGNEFIENLKEKGIKYEVVFEGLEIFKLTNVGVAGGKRFDIIEYVRPSNGKRTLVASGGFGSVDWVVEEIYLFDLEEEQTYTSEEVAAAIRNYIIDEDNNREKEEKEMFELRSMIYDEVKEVAKTLIDNSFKLDFKVPGKSMDIETSITDTVRERLEDREVGPIEVKGYFLKDDKEDIIIIHNKFDILGQKTEIRIHLAYNLEGDNIIITNAY